MGLQVLAMFHGYRIFRLSQKRRQILKGWDANARLCGLMVRVPGCRTEMYCFLWDTNWIYIYYVEERRPPLWSSGQSSWLQNGHVLCLLWGTNWIDIYYVEERRPPMWSSGQSSWLQIQRSGLDSRLYQILWAVVGLERDPLSIESTTEELLERNNSGCRSRNPRIRP
jgi:hypothetical protein